MFNINIVFYYALMLLFSSCVPRLFCVTAVDGLPRISLGASPLSPSGALSRCGLLCSSAVMKLFFYGAPCLWNPRFLLDRPPFASPWLTVCLWDSCASF
ncbi:hypothetical protein NPIL_367381 [Nephila pilipes]|uniref:Uncharacterized protein n=1 Tax=Nephila pilipes TaxID=299642 RepID=A0A8X6MWD8_NEPPI|nr:hypothetical protein NPIL_367381 [Nephila pilipes]